MRVLIVRQPGWEPGCHQVPSYRKKIIQLRVALRVLIEYFLNQKERIGVNADADRLEGNTVLQGEGVE